MLRTTISRIRKVCSVAFIPRILRGDQCSATVSSAVIRKVHKSTKSTEEGEKASTAESKDVPDYTFSSAAQLRIDNKFKRKISEASAGLGDDKTANKINQPILTAGLPLTHRERCQRIIDQAFGKSDNMPNDRVLSEQYFSHTVNLEDTRRAIHESEKAKLKLQEQKIQTDNPLLPDDRSQYSIFKMSRELNVNDDNLDESIITDSASAREPEVTKNLENVKGTGATTRAKETPPAEEPNLSEAKEDFDKCVNNPESKEKKALCDDDGAETIEVVKDERNPDVYLKATPTYQPHVPWFLKATTTREPQLTYAKEDFDDECLNNQESVEKKALCDAETIKSVKDERKHDLLQEATPNDQPHTPQVLNSTTAQEEEELLTQKLETIEETPIVEAHKPKVEGFNVTPKILGNEPTLKSKIIENNQDNSSKVNLPGALDEVSKRCLNCPLGQIDDMLINEMEKLGMTYKTAQKAPSTPMEDDLVQMDILNKQQNSIIEKQEIQSESPKLEEKENEKATDSRKPNVNEKAEAPSKSEEIVKATEAHDILHPDHIRIQLKPLACKTEEHNPADDHNSTTKFACYSPPAHRAAEINKQEIDETLPNSRSPINKQIQKPFSLNRPLLKGPLAEETPISHAYINNQNAQTYLIQTIEGNVLSDTAQNAKTASATAEAEKTSAEDINTNVTSFDPLNDASDNIRRERLLKPENSNYFKGVTPSYNATMNASAKSSFYSRNLAAGVWGHHQNGSVSKYRNVQTTLPKETEEVEHDGQTPISQSTTKVQGELEKRKTTADRLFVKEPYTNFSLPGENWKKEIGDLPTMNTITQQCSKKLYSTAKSQLKPEQGSENASLPEEILKQHKLDPYYVLTCNETCPISPGSTMSAYQNSDFVDTTETLYMKRNIFESVRPNKPIVKCANMSSDTEQTQLNELDKKPETETMPDIKDTDMTKIRCTSIPDAIGSMPRLGEQMALSELLRTVRERSRLACSAAKSGLDMQAVGKCGGKAPKCAPMAPRAPPYNPVPPPMFGLPKLKRRPPVCKPVRKPSDKCSTAMNVGEIFLVMPYELDEAEVCAGGSKVNLTDEVIDRLQNFSKIFGVVLRQVKSNVETLLARDYEPWAPIPSWKIPQKAKKEWRSGMHGVPPCVDGCPVFPKDRASMNPEPPCNLKPCEGFPKRRSFSMLDCFAVSLGENKVYDLGDF